jgi:hypothetical protein
MTSFREAAAALLAGLTDRVGSETLARKILADIPDAAMIVAALPKRPAHRPTGRDRFKKRLKDEQIRTLFALGQARGMTWEEIANLLREFGLASSTQGALVAMKRLKLGKRRAAKGVSHKASVT